MRNLIIIAILLGGGAYALATPGPQPTEPRASAATAAEARLIASLRALAAPPVLTEDAYAARPLDTQAAPVPAPAETATAEAAEVLVVKPEALNLRAAPSKNGEVLGRLLQGESVEVAGRENGWVQVANAEGVVGWAHGDFLAATH